MQSLSNNGAYTVSSEVLAKINESFVGYYADENATAEQIKKNFEAKPDGVYRGVLFSVTGRIEYLS